MKLSQLKKCVSFIQKKVKQHIHKVNWGGCGVFASLLADQMINAGIPEEEIKILVYSYEGEDYDLCEIEDSIDHHCEDIGSLDVWESYLPDLVHIRVSWKDHVFDAEDNIDLVANNLSWGWGALLCNGHISLEAVRELSKDNNWNPEFDRSQIPTLEKIIKETFAKFT